MAPTLLHIVAAGIGMALLSLSGALTLLLPRRLRRGLILPMVALAAGSMLGGALFHLLPEAVSQSGNELGTWLIAALGFVAFLLLERFLHWHHGHDEEHDHRHAAGYLVLLADAVHNLVGGLAVGGAFVSDPALGWTVWMAAAAHEIPQELGDFGVLVHGGWSPKHALAANFASSLTFPLGGMIAYGASLGVDVGFLVAFAAGNFLYVGAADLLPEVARDRAPGPTVIHLLAFTLGLGILVLLRWVTTAAG